MFWKKKRENKISNLIRITSTGIQVEASDSLALHRLKNQGIVDEHNFLTYQVLYDVLDNTPASNSTDGVDPIEDEQPFTYDDEFTQVVKVDLASLGIPVVPANIHGQLNIIGLPQHAEFELILKDGSGRTLERIGHDYGAMFEVEGTNHLLSKELYQLRNALTDSYENAQTKIAEVQKCAIAAKVEMDGFLQNNRFHVVDDVKLGMNYIAPDEIELTFLGDDAAEDQLLERAFHHNNDGMTVRDGMTRDRLVLSTDTKHKVQALKPIRRIKGEEVARFVQDPRAVLPDELLDVDLSEFSDRVRGIIQVKQLMPRRTGTGIEWVDQDGNPLQVDTDRLREWLTENPERKFFEHEGQWLFIPPYWRKAILGEEGEVPRQLATLYRLDIAENLEDLEYKKSMLEKEFKEVALPYGLKADLFEHQRVGYLWLNHLNDRQSGGLLADDMGLGKTLQVITFFLHLHNQQKLKPSMVVLPKSLIENWQNEIRQFAPALMNGVYIHRGSERLRKKEQIEKADIVLTTYDTLRRDQTILGKIDFKVIACDEAQNMKTHSGQRSHAMRAMKADFRLAMTGTPVETKLEDLWTIMDFVSPGLLGSLKEFKRNYEDTSDMLALKSALLPVFLRRTKKEVLASQLPVKHPAIIHRVEATPLQTHLGLALKQPLDVVGFNANREDTPRQNQVLETIMRLRQLYSHPNLILPTEQQVPYLDTNKMNKMIEIVRNVKQKNEKILIFTDYLQMQAMLQETIYAEFGVEAPIINGKTVNRTMEVDRFNKRIGFAVMILSPKAAGVGLNITSANHVLHYTRWWNPAVENQATDRVYRIGQKREVYIYQIITEDATAFPNGTLESHIHSLLETRQDMADDVIVPHTDEMYLNILKTAIAN